MVKVVKIITDLIGNTPMLELTNFSKKHSINARIIKRWFLTYE